MEIIILVGLLILLTFLSGYFSSTEVALFSLSSIKIKSYEKNKDPRKRLIAQLVLQPRDLLVTVFMLNTIVNILLQNVASHMFGSEAGWELSIGVPLVLTLLFGEIIPKYIGIQNNVTISYYVAPVINFLQNVLTPVRKLVIRITLPISRVLFFFLKKEKSISKDELQHVIKKSEEQGVLQREEAELVWGYLNLQNATVKELMRPREDMLYYDLKEPLSKLIYLLVDQQCSRLPVCDNNVQNILGIIDARRFFLYRNAVDKPHDLISLLEKPFYVPETTLARMLLRRLDEKDQELAMVVNEYGFITGLITYEDLVEVVVGKIADFRDQKQLYTKAGPNEIIASGKLELLEFNQIFHVELESHENMVTIGGWLTEQFGEIPKTGTKWETHGFLFHILAANPTHIRRLYIRKINPTTTPTEKL